MQPQNGLGLKKAFRHFLTRGEGKKKTKEEKKTRDEGGVARKRRWREDLGRGLEKSELVEMAKKSERGCFTKKNVPRGELEGKKEG